MEKYYLQFKSDIPELVKEFKDFVIQVNRFLVGLATDERYHKSQTRGKSKTRHVIFEGEKWKFEGKRHREDMPYVDEATMSFRGQEMWKMTRKSALMPNTQYYAEGIQHCLWEVAKNYNPDKPWCGPNRFTDKESGLVYKAGYSGTDKKFIIEETIHDKSGALLWQAICEGGYV